MTGQKDEFDYDAVYGQDFDVSNIPHGWIQWKGTDVCIGLHCKCGFHDHFDGWFFYYYKCPKCDAKYALGQTVKLIELTPEQAKYAETTGCGFGETEGAEGLRVEKLTAEFWGEEWSPKDVNDEEFGQHEKGELKK